MNKDKIPMILGTAIIAYLIHALNPGKIISLLANIKLSFFILALAINFLDEIISAKILYALLKRPDLRFKDVFLSHISGMLYSDITPAKVGYYYTAISLSKKSDLKKTTNIGVITAIQGIVFLTKAAGCLLGIAYFSYMIGKNMDESLVYLAALVPLVGFAGTIIFFTTKIPQKLAAKLPYLHAMIENITHMQDAVKKMNKKDFQTALSLTLVIWFLVGLQWYLIAHAIGVGISLLDAIFLRPLITAIGFIPLTPNGLGLAEGGGAIIFSAIGFTAQEGLAFVLLTRINQLIVSSLGLLDLKG
ncbi:MAG: lysylphosphatidylglycerol synthase transmembrane domain-containing protein [Candidatus Altiarchaeota archaeon]